MDALTSAAKAAEKLKQDLAGLSENTLAKALGTSQHEKLLLQGGASFAELERVLRIMSPQRYGAVGITLGRADSIAKFFAFSFVATEKLPLAELAKHPFWGSGVYAIYYHGKNEPAYAPLSNTETPIYVGKVDPTDAFAESIEAQGQALFKRLKEHAGNIGKTKLKITDFKYRAATIQSGMQAAVEEFMLRLFRPIWNKSVGVAHGLGKHGDSAKTRANKRSPWDTMHPGRKWATDTVSDQAEQHVIVARIEAHLKKHPVIRNKAKLFEKLSLR
jgi:hypothetical protein